MGKILFFDCETTGLDPVKHQIIQMAGIVEIDGKIEREFEIKMRPGDGVEIDPRAMQVNKRDVAEIRSWPTPASGYEELRAILSHWVDPFDAADKFILAGQNVFFDRNMIFGLASRCGDPYFGSFIFGATLDTLSLASLCFLDGMEFGSKHKPSFKLDDLCKTLGVEPGGHDALGDIRATRLVAYRLLECLNRLPKFSQGGRLPTRNA